MKRGRRRTHLTWGALPSCLMLCAGMGTAPSASAAQTRAASVQAVRLAGGQDSSERVTGVLSGQGRWSAEWTDYVARISGAVWLDLSEPGESLINIDELSITRSWSAAELMVGVGYVAWGMSEVRSPVDVLTPRAVLGGTWGGPELGQPMIDLTWFPEVGSVDLVILPFQRPIHLAEFDWRTWSGAPLEREGEWLWDPAVGIEFSSTSSAFDWTLSYTDGADRSLGTTPVSGGSSRLHHPRLHQVGAGIEWAAGASWTVRGEGTAGLSDGEWSGRGILAAEWFPAPYISLLLESGLTTRGLEARSPLEDDVMLGVSLVGETFRAQARLFVDPGSGALHPDVSLRLALGGSLFVEGTWMASFGNTSQEPPRAIRQPGYLQFAISRYF